LATRGGTLHGWLWTVPARHDQIASNAVLTWPGCSQGPRVEQDAPAGSVKLSFGKRSGGVTQHARPSIRHLGCVLLSPALIGRAMA
jgi:hypothetical protein